MHEIRYPYPKPYLTYVPAYQNKVESEYAIGMIAAFPDTHVVGQKAAVLSNYFFFLSGLLS